MIKANCRCGKTQKTFSKLTALDWFINEDCCFAAGYNALGEVVVKNPIVESKIPTTLKLPKKKQRLK